MFPQQTDTGAALMSKGIESQVSLLTSLSGRFLNVSLQLAELNRQASRRLLEETAADMQRAMQIRTLSDAQSFLAEQSRTSLDKVQGYWLNVQTIAAGNWKDTSQPPVTVASAQAAQDEAVSPQSSEDTKNYSKSASDHKHPHEVDPQPSALVEKLVASVVPDTARQGS